MISGTAGTGKTSIGALMANASCARGEKALFFSFEESPEQLIRNMRSIGIDLQRWIDAGLLQVRAVRPTAFGFEEHLAMLHRLLDEHEPQLVVLDAVASLTHAGAQSATTSAISRDLDLLKGRGITSVMTDPDPRGARGVQRGRRVLAGATPGCCCATTRATASATGCCS